MYLIAVPLFRLDLQVFHSSQMEQRLSWLQAHLFCRRHNANLLSISGTEEEQFVLQTLNEEFGWVVGLVIEVR